MVPFRNPEALPKLPKYRGPVNVGRVPDSPLLKIELKFPDTQVLKSFVLSEKADLSVIAFLHI